MVKAAVAAALMLSIAVMAADERIGNVDITGRVRGIVTAMGAFESEGNHKPVPKPTGVKLREVKK